MLLKKLVEWLLDSLSRQSLALRLTILGIGAVILAIIFADRFWPSHTFASKDEIWQKSIRIMKADDLTATLGAPASKRQALKGDDETWTYASEDGEVQFEVHDSRIRSMSPSPCETWTKAIFAERFDAITQGLMFTKLGKPNRSQRTEGYGDTNEWVYKAADGNVVFFRDSNDVVRIKK